MTYVFLTKIKIHCDFFSLGLFKWMESVVCLATSFVPSNVTLTVAFLTRNPSCTDVGNFQFVCSKLRFI